MAINFAVAFSATDSAFGVAGTYYDSAGTKTCTMILEALGGQIQTVDGVYIPDADCVIDITKSQMGTNYPIRGGLIVQGTDSYDVIDPPQQDPSRLSWICSCKRRQP